MKALQICCLLGCCTGSLFAQAYVPAQGEWELTHVATSYAQFVPVVRDTVLLPETASPAFHISDIDLPQPNDSIMHALGKQNARLYFKRPAVFTASALGTTLGIATAGITLAVPIALAAIPAKVKEEDIPDPYLMQSSSYMAGYTSEAKKRKRMTVLKGTGVGVLGAGVVVGTLYLIIRSLSHI